MIYEITTNDLGIKIVHSNDIINVYKEDTTAVTHTGNYLHFSTASNASAYFIDLTQQISLNGVLVVSATYLQSYLSDFLTSSLGEINTDHIYEKTSGHGVNVDGALIKDSAFDTNIAAAGVTLSGTSLIADGTDTNIPITITPKGIAGILTIAGTIAKPAYSFTADPDTGIINSGTNSIGFVTNGSEKWTMSSSGGLNPATDNSANSSIGTVAATPSKVYAGTKFSLKGIDVNSKYGLLETKYVAAKVTLGVEPTEITINIPSGVRLLAVQFSVSVLITAATATSWKASFTGGSTAVINAGTNAFAAETKLNVMLSEATMAVTAVTTDVTQISIISNDGSDFTTGEISAVVYYEELTSITT